MPALVSVILPFLNMARFLPDAVESVAAQTHRAWELLLVDDGSQPEEAQRAREIVARLAPHAHFLQHADGATHGASATRNLGLSQARGEYIAYLDADDIWLAGKLARQVELLERHPQAAMTFGRVRYFSDNPDGPGEFDQPFSPLRAGLYHPPSLTLEFLRDASIYPCPTAVLVRREALRAVGGFEGAFRKVRTDLVAWTKINTRFTVHADDAILARYRQHAQSSVAQMNAAGEYLRYETAFYDWLLHYLERLPAGIRSEIEPFACERMTYYSIQWALRAGWSSRLAWRLAVAGRLARYPAFWRGARWLRSLGPSRPRISGLGEGSRPE